MATNKKLKIGYSDFKRTITENGYFVDKSLLIKDFIDSSYQILLVPRPRRFGKTMNLSMLRYFFDIREENSPELFKDLKISVSGDEIMQHAGKYPVIYLSLKDAKALTWEKTYQLIIAEIVRLYRSFEFLLESDTLSSYEKKEFETILDNTAPEIQFHNSLKNLSEYLHRYYKQHVIILIDEYDTAIQAGYKNFYEEAVSFMRNLLSGAFKDNTHLYKGLITGILRVSRESIFSGLNNLGVNSILENTMSDKFGFTENELKQMLLDFELAGDFANLKSWYNGYKFGNTQNIYNPWSIINYVAYPNEGLKPYWSNSSSNDLIKAEIQDKNSGIIRDEMIQLISGKCIVKDLEPNFVFPDLKQRRSLVWTLFAFSGYLTTKKHVSLYDYELCIPNYEIKTIFQRTIMEWFETELQVVKSRLVVTTNYLITNQLTKFESGFRQIMGDTFSYFDIHTNPENVYQAYTLGLLALIGDDYVIKSNRESGDGRYDIIMIPFDKTKNGVVIEIKSLPVKNHQLSDEELKQKVNQNLQKALQQIDNNAYYSELTDVGIPPENIVKVPIVFVGKTPYIVER